MKKRLQELSFRDDFMFYKVMSDDALCKEVLELLIGHKIRKNIRKRSRYYQSSIDVENLYAGIPYENLQNNVVIFLCNFPIFDGKHHIYSFQNMCEQYPKLYLGDGTSKIFYSVVGDDEEVSSDLLDFLGLVNAKDVENYEATTDLVHRLRQRILAIRSDARMEDEAMTFELKLEDERRRGMKQGLEQGLERGLERGRREASELAIQKERKTILKMKMQGLSNETIADMLDVSVEYVIQCKDEVS